MMPRLAKLISERSTKSKSYSTSPLGHAWKRINAKGSKEVDSSSNGAGSAGSPLAGQTKRLQHPYEQLEEVETLTSGNSRRTSKTEDIESGIPILEMQEFGELLERRLDIEFTVPKFSFH